MKLLRNQKGVSIVNVLMASGLMGFLALIMASMSKNMSGIQMSGQSSFDEQELLSMARMIIGEESFCRVSLAGTDIINNPVKFYKTQLDDYAAGEGMDVELWTSDSTGVVRSSKRLYTGLKQGRVTITQLKFVLPSITVPSPGSNYPQGVGLDMASLYVGYTKNLGGKTRNVTTIMPFIINISTATSGETTLLSCHR